MKTNSMEKTILLMSRINHMAQRSKQSKNILWSIERSIVRQVTALLCVILNKDIGCEVPLSTTFLHSGVGVVLGPGTKIDPYCTIGQNVTMGWRNDGSPTVRHHSIILPNAVLLGRITIGHHCVVGAGSVVLESFPPYSMIWGNPARKQRQMTSEEYIEFHRQWVEQNVGVMRNGVVESCC